MHSLVILETHTHEYVFKVPCSFSSSQCVLIDSNCHQYVITWMTPFVTNALFVVTLYIPLNT